MRYHCHAQKRSSRAPGVLLPRVPVGPEVTAARSSTLGADSDRTGRDGANAGFKLGLPFEADEDWDIHIAIPLRGTKDHPLIAKNVVRLHIRPDPDWQWELTSRIADRGEFSESDKKSYRNDLGFPTLGRGNLHAFPDWLRQVREKCGIDFDIEASDIRVGRRRAAAKIVSKWLAD